MKTLCCGKTSHIKRTGVLIESFKENHCANPAQESRVALWWERSSPTNVARVQIPDPVSHVGWVCCWFSPCSEGFSPGSLVFLLPQKSTFLNSNSIGNSRATGLSVLRLLCATLVKQSKFIYLFIYLLRGTCTKILFCGRGLKLFSSLRVTNS